MTHIIPIRELKNTSEISARCHNTAEPIYITKNGYGDMVIMSIEHYGELSERLKMYESLLRSEIQIKNNEATDAISTLTGLREKYGL